MRGRTQKLVFLYPDGGVAHMPIRVSRDSFDCSVDRDKLVIVSKNEIRTYRLAYTAD